MSVCVCAYTFVFWACSGGVRSRLSMVRSSGRAAPGTGLMWNREGAARPLDRTIDVRISIVECIEQNRGVQYAHLIHTPKRSPETAKDCLRRRKAS